MVIRPRAHGASRDVAGTLLIGNGGTGLTELGTASQILRVNSGATALEYGVLGEYRTLHQAAGSHTAARVADTYHLGHGDVAGTGNQADAFNIIYIDNADYTTAGVENKLRVLATLHVNNVAPTGNYTIGLHPVTRPGSSGGAGACIYTIGAAVAGSTVTFTTPAADSSNQGNSGDFAMPADGYYILGMVSTATVAGSSHLHITAHLQIHRV
jgi:hypothetical protein